MQIHPQIKEFTPQLVKWRQQMHAHPQTCYQEVFAADLIAEALQSFGIQVQRGMAVTGVIGVLEGQGQSDKCIGLRADTDALNIQEENQFGYKSVYPGKMHACGHDGHTTMLLGAAKYLAETRNFNGRVVFIFQPAEEGGAGGKRMIEEGLFKQFPIQTVWGLHNWPGLPVGQAAMKDGVMMASADEFIIHIHGKGAHAAMPHVAVDPVVTASQIIMALQTVVSRNLRPVEAGVITVAKINAGSAFNIIPEKATLNGTMRSLSETARNTLEKRSEQLVLQIAEAFGAKAEFNYHHGYPVLVNALEQTNLAEQAAVEVLGRENVSRAIDPVLGAEDFAFLLEEKPGCYIFLGNGPTGGKGGQPVHTPTYDFNDDLLPVGAAYWAKLAENLLA